MQDEVNISEQLSSLKGSSTSIKVELQQKAIEGGYTVTKKKKNRQKNKPKLCEIPEPSAASKEETTKEDDCSSSQGKSSTVTSGKGEGKSNHASKNGPSTAKETYESNEKDARIAILEARVETLRNDRDAIFQNFLKKTEKQEDEIELLKWKVKFLEDRLTSV